MSPSAYVDESYDVPSGFYILGAAIVDGSNRQSVADELRPLRCGTGKLHWQAERPDRRLELAKAARRLNATYLAVIGCAQRLRSERARRKCMMALLPELARRQVDAMVLESRQRWQDELDMALVRACRKQRLILPWMSATCCAASDEPLLWLPDIVCGAAYAAERGQPEYLAVLDPVIRYVDAG